MFFASIQSFNDLFEASEDPSVVIIDFLDAHVHDHSAVAAIDALTSKYVEQGKEVHLRHLSIECRELIRNAEKFVEINVLEDPHYHVATDTLA